MPHGMPRKRPDSRSTHATPDARALRRLQARLLRHGTRALYDSGPLYDQLYRRRRQDVRFYIEAAEHYGGPVLELGVGTGRVAFALAQAGIEVVGVDAMPSMLRHARARGARLPRATFVRVALRRGDMRALRLGRKFPLVIVPFNAFTHLYTRRDLERALAVCRAHLLPRGRLVFDVPMPDLRALLQDPERLYKCGTTLDPHDGTRYAHSEASEYDAAAQIRNVTILLEHDNGGHRQRALPLTQRQFFPAELEALLFYNGFAIERRYGDFAGGPLTRDSESQVIVARAIAMPARARRGRARA
jgi:SAM-dependent methyltransferase